MSLTSCGLHGIKLSTFVRGVAMEGLTITSPRQAGVEVRGGSDVAVRRCRILSPGETAVRLGGGARNVVVERNLIRWVARGSGCVGRLVAQCGHEHP